MSGHTLVYKYRVIDGLRKSKMENNHNENTPFPFNTGPNADMAYRLVIFDQEIENVEEATVTNVRR